MSTKKIQNGDPGRVQRKRGSQVLEPTIQRYAPPCPGADYGVDASPERLNTAVIPSAARDLWSCRGTNRPSDPRSLASLRMTGVRRRPPLSNPTMCPNAIVPGPLDIFPDTGR